MLKILKLIIFCFMIFMIYGCAGIGNEKKFNDHNYKGTSGQLKKENKDLQEAYDETMSIEQQQLPEQLATPIIPEYNPLDNINIGLNMNNKPLKDALYAIATAANMNLVIEPGLALEDKVTVNFTNVRARILVEKLLSAHDIFWTVKENVLEVKKFEERTFDLGFPNASTLVQIDNGGDIYGASTEKDTTSGSSTGGSGSNDLAGNFKINTSIGGKNENSVYNTLEKSMSAIIGDNINGMYTLDSISGVLYCKTTPSKMKNISKIIADIQSKMGKQIIIDARIVEVTLSDNLQFGINWNQMLNRIGQTSISGGFNMTTAGNVVTSVIPSNNPSANLNVKRGSSEEMMQTTLEALQSFGSVKTVASPKIRAKHSQPAMITSGRSEAYVKEVQTNFTEEGFQFSETPTTAKVFSGVMLGVYPYVTRDGSVDLQIFPIKSSADLTKTSTIGNNQITLPKIDVQNILTSVQVRDGDTIILGGLISKSYAKDDKGIPGAMEAPGIGFLFRNRVKTEKITELVVIMNIRVKG